MDKAFSRPGEVFAYFQTFTDFEKKKKQTIREYRLDRMYRILALFDDPHLSMKTIHIAGSKGKGSTGIYIARALAEAGERTGLYTSPHVADYRERITLAGDFVEDKTLLRCGAQIAEHIENIRRLDLDGSSEPTTFELLTLLAFLVFREKGCDYAVIETGIGGRLDATNVVEPVATIITPIELEHTDVLGNTLREIAAEKAGIIKEGVPLFLSSQHEEAEKVFLQTAQRRHAPINLFDKIVRSYTAETNGEGTKVDAELEGVGAVRFTLGMLGEFQAKNALLAYLLIRSILGDDKQIDARIKKALREAHLPGRMELIRNTFLTPPVLLDGAHTPASVSTALETYRSIFHRPPVCIFGSVYGKNAVAMADILAPRCRHIIVSKPGSFKPSDPEEVRRIFEVRTPHVELILDARQAFLRAVEAASLHEKNSTPEEASLVEATNSRTPILVIGSFYMVAEIRPLVDKETAKKREERESELSALKASPLPASNSAIKEGQDL